MIKQGKKTFKKTLNKSILGPFLPTLDRANAVDFSRPFWSGFYTVVIPLENKSKMWYIIEPYHHYAWIVLITSILIFFITLGMMDYLYCRVIDWDYLGGFLIRNVLS